MKSFSRYLKKKTKNLNIYLDKNTKLVNFWTLKIYFYQCFNLIHEYNLNVRGLHSTKSQSIDCRETLCI